MKPASWFVASCAFLVLAALAPSALARDREAPSSRAGMTLSFAPVVRKTAPAVVNVYARTMVRRQGNPLFADPFFRQFFGDGPFGIPRDRVQNSLGSGVIVSTDGLIVTNTHVIGGRDSEILVMLNDGRKFPAKILLADERADIAVMKIEPEGRELPYLRFGDSDALEVGDLVLAIGNPFGVGQTVTSGIISALARTARGLNDDQFFIQTDAAINPGNSGGALIDVNGRLIGLNTAIYSRSGGSNGIGFAIPANMVKTIVEAARKGNKAVQPWLGATFQALTPDIAASLGLDAPYGALVNALHPDSPLADAGIRRGDVIVEFDGHGITTPRELSFRLAAKPVGGSATLTYWRDGATHTVKVALIAPPETTPRHETTLSGDTPFSGLVVANLSPALAYELRLDHEESGVVVLDVKRGPARRIGFRDGDVIVTVNGREIGNVDDMLDVIAAHARIWRFAIKRDGHMIQTTIGG
ncbi:MAG: DegQ family serine endoprotease [Hyphomicrobiales bacterium]